MQNRDRTSWARSLSSVSLVVRRHDTRMRLSPHILAVLASVAIVSGGHLLATPISSSLSVLAASTNSFVSDPGWVGVLEQPQLRHDWTIGGSGQHYGQQRDGTTYLMFGRQEWSSHFSFCTSAAIGALSVFAACVAGILTLRG